MRACWIMHLSYVVRAHPALANRLDTAALPLQPHMRWNGFCRVLSVRAPDICERGSTPLLRESWGTRKKFRATAQEFCKLAFAAAVQDLMGWLTWSGVDELGHMHAGTCEVSCSQVTLLQMCNCG